MMKKIFTLLIIGLWLGSSLNAQTPLKNLRYALNRKSITRVLEARNVQSLNRACQRASSISPERLLLWGMLPSDRLSALTVNPQEIYPDAPFLKNKRQLSLYALARHNREVTKWAESMDKEADWVRDHLRDFVKAVVPMPQDGQEIPWLIRQMPQDLSYLLVGEKHDPSGFHFPKISDLLLAVRRQYPERQIFLFTEFLSTDPELIENLPQKEFLANIKNSDFLNMQVVGLEPPAVCRSRQVDLCLDIPFWSGIEGLRLRNRAWLQTLQTYRQQYPDALFIVYAGHGHLSYSHPHSLGQALAGEDTFVVSLCPAPRGENIFLSLFDWYTQGTFTNVHALRFNHPELRRRAGFDAQIKVDAPEP